MMEGVEDGIDALNTVLGKIDSEDEGLFALLNRRSLSTVRRIKRPLKVVKYFQVKAYDVLSFLLAPKAFAAFLAEEFAEACRLCLMDVRKRLSTAQKIRMEWQASSLA